mmetsp:Transcript_142236/g.354444  ORF Transcript_142236/g.354444 Transcript_142236/m.354444 type:complete len:217 (+) Transcript_142236:170-820(+)
MQHTFKTIAELHEGCPLLDFLDHAIDFPPHLRFHASQGHVLWMDDGLICLLPRVLVPPHLDHPIIGIHLRDNSTAQQLIFRRWTRHLVTDPEVPENINFLHPLQVDVVFQVCVGGIFPLDPHCAVIIDADDISSSPHRDRWVDGLDIISRLVILEDQTDRGLLDVVGLRTSLPGSRTPTYSVGAVLIVSPDDASVPSIVHRRQGAYPIVDLERPSL